VTRSSNNSYFGSEIQRTQSRPALLSKESSPLKAHVLGMEGSSTKLPRSSKPSEDVGELLMRHNSYSLITDTKRDRFKPMIKLDAKTDILTVDKGSSRPAKNFSSKPDSNYGQFKKTVVKKRSSKMLFTQLGFASGNKPSNRIDAILNNRKTNENGSINVKNTAAYLMGRVSPHSRTFNGDNFRFEFLDHSINGPQSPALAGSLANLQRHSGAMPYLNGHGTDKSLRSRLGSNTKNTVEDVDDSQSSTSMSAIESNMTTLTSKMTATVNRLSQFVRAFKADRQEKLARFEAMARENGILKEKLKALERKQS
jgi:hypothetical protein